MKDPPDMNVISLESAPCPAEMTTVVDGQTITSYAAEQITVEKGILTRSDNDQQLDTGLLVMYCGKTKTAIHQTFSPEDLLILAARLTQLAESMTKTFKLH